MKIRTFTTSITGFSNYNGALIIYFDKKEDTDKGTSTYKKAVAHPALQVKPHIGKVQEIQIAETEQGWKMIKPYPTAEELQRWEQIKAEREALESAVTEATAEQLALLTF